MLKTGKKGIKGLLSNALHKANQAKLNSLP